MQGRERGDSSLNHSRSQEMREEGTAKNERTDFLQTQKHKHSSL